MFSAAARRRLTRKSSNAENIMPRAKVYKASRLAASDPLRDSSSRRRNRVLSRSGYTSVSYTVANHVKRQRLIKPHIVVKTLPTPPASPGAVSVDVDMEIDATSNTPEPLAQPTSSRPSTRTLNIPRALVRPPRVEAQREALAAVDPSFEKIPAPYVRDATEYLTPGMTNVLRGLRLQPLVVEEGQSFPTELTLTVTDVSAEMPSHILAVIPPAAAKGVKSKVSVYPVHHVLMATQCVRVQLPSTKPIPRPAAGSTITVPVVPITLPHPESFFDIQAFLYTKNMQALLNHLLPRAPPKNIFAAAETRDSRTFAEMIADTFTPQVILRYMKHTHGMYRNVCALGIQDDRLWLVLNKAWEILSVAATISSQQLMAMRR